VSDLEIRPIGPGDDFAAQLDRSRGWELAGGRYTATIASRDAGPLTWDEGPFRQWLSRPDLYTYLARDEGFTAYRRDGADGIFVERAHATSEQALRALWAVIAAQCSTGRWQLTAADGKGMLIPNDGVASPGSRTLGPRGVAARYAGSPAATLRLAGLAAGGAQADDAGRDAVFAATPYLVDDF
jgi:hypothetical protein